MERRFQVRLDELREDAQVPPRLLDDLLPRLETFLQPFVVALETPERRTNAQQYVQGLLADLKSKDVESIAYLHDRERQGLQKFMGQTDWDHRPPVDELVRQIADQLGQSDGVLICDPSAFAKKGTASVGVQRQWCGRLGKIENCQVGLYLGYSSGRGEALADFRLYLPKEWARRKRRRKKAGVPEDIRFRTRHELFLEMLDERGPQLPHAWISGDDEMGRCSWFREQLRTREECYLLAVPCNTLVRDLKTPTPPSNGPGRQRRVPLTRVDQWCAALPATAWQSIEVRDAEHGPVVVEVVWTLVQARGEGRLSDVAEWLVVFRERQGDGSWKHDYLLSNAALDTPLREFARVFKAQHRIEECLKRAKGEAGLADYQLRTWPGWHHHQTLSLLAAWFLTRETRRGKKMDPGVDGAAGAVLAGRSADRPFGLLPPRANPPHDGSPFAAQPGGALLPLEAPQPLAATPL